MFARLTTRQINPERIDEFIYKLKDLKSGKNKKGIKIKNLVPNTKKEFEQYMDDDFNTPKGLASIFKLVTKGNRLIDKNKMTPQDAKNILNFLKEVDQIFNFIFWKKPKKEKIPKKILELAKEREKYREQKKWQKADEIRKEIKQMGWRVEDTEKGPKLKKLS